MQRSTPGMKSRSSRPASSAWHSSVVAVSPSLTPFVSPKQIVGMPTGSE
jgi:hypothetical protein